VALWWGNNPETRDGATGAAGRPGRGERGRGGERSLLPVKKCGIGFALTRSGTWRCAVCGQRGSFGTEADLFAAKFAWPTADNDWRWQQRFDADRGTDVPRARVDYAEKLEKPPYEIRAAATACGCPSHAAGTGLGAVSSEARGRALASGLLLSALSGTVFVSAIAWFPIRCCSLLLAALLSDIVFGTRDLGGGRTARIVKAVLAIVVVIASLYVERVRLDRSWYRLPAEVPPTTSSAPMAANAALAGYDRGLWL